MADMRSATLHRLQAQGLRRVLVLDSPRYELGAVLAWLQARPLKPCSKASTVLDR
jgi:hypothetical protein